MQKQPQRHKDAPVKTFKTTTAINTTVERHRNTTKEGFRMIFPKPTVAETCKITIKENSHQVTKKNWGDLGDFNISCKSADI